jgi:hypothetical protein
LTQRKKRKPVRARCIRSYERIAQQSHGVCPFCHSLIEAGDEYEGSVWVNGAELWVVKQHLFCELWDSKWYRWYREENVEIIELMEKDFDLPMAA